MDWLTRKAMKFALKEVMAAGFFLSCGLAKLFPLFEGGNYKADAIIYMLIIALLYFVWDNAR